MTPEEVGDNDLEAAGGGGRCLCGSRQAQGRTYDKLKR